MVAFIDTCQVARRRQLVKRSRGARFHGSLPAAEDARDLLNRQV
jgi:hypothetical protein